jgi:hypothetical protein
MAIGGVIRFGGKVCIGDKGMCGVGCGIVIQASLRDEFPQLE